MNMLSPITAMLWENWRLTRIEAAIRFVQNLVTAAGAVILFDAGVKVVFWFLLAGTAFIWFSIAKLNGGRFMDGYKPGFPLYLLYTKPVRTSVIVGVTMAYDAISNVALYLVTAALLGYAFDMTLPLFSLTVFLITCHATYFCVQYSTTSRIVQWAGSMVFIPLFFLLLNRVSTPLEVEFSLAENAAMGLVCLLSFGLTVVGVARQRRGEITSIVPKTPAASGYPDWLVNLFRIPCPTSSPTGAQVWFELKSTGVPVITIGLAMALAIFVLYAVGIAVAPVRPAAVAAPIMFGLPALLFLLGGNAFGIRRKQGRTYLSPFEATQPYDTSRLVSVKVLVRTACLLIALIAVGASLWASSSLMNAWEAWVPEGQTVDAKPGLLKARQDLGNTLGGLPGQALAALAALMILVVTLVVASLATFKALRTRFPRGVLVSGVLLFTYALLMVLLLLAADRGLVPDSLQQAVFSASKWIAAAAMVAVTIYLLSSGFASRTLTAAYVGGALLVPAILGALGLFADDATGPLWVAMLVLIVSLLAPWSLDRLRHA